MHRIRELGSLKTGNKQIADMMEQNQGSYLGTLSSRGNQKKKHYIEIKYSLDSS